MPIKLNVQRGLHI